VGLFLKTKNMEEKFVRVLWIKAHHNYAYSAGNTGHVKAEDLEKLLKDGYVVPLQDEEDEKINTLPEDLPARDILFAEGFDTAEKVQEAGESITDIKGISKATYKQIVAYFEK